MIGDEGKCAKCGENICIFVQFEADVVGLRGWHQRASALDTNRERRKHAFRTFFRWSGGIGGKREQLEECVVIGVRSLYPSNAYMGFYPNDDRTSRRRAVNMYGEALYVWWEFIDGEW